MRQDHPKPNGHVCAHTAALKLNFARRTKCSDDLETIKRTHVLVLYLWMGGRKSWKLEHLAFYTRDFGKDEVFYFVHLISV